MDLVELIITNVVVELDGKSEQTERHDEGTFIEKKGRYHKSIDPVRF
jgi:hypothetical protein